MSVLLSRRQDWGSFFSSIEFLIIRIFFNLKKMLKYESLPSHRGRTDTFSKSPNMDPVGLGLEIE